MNIYFRSLNHFESYESSNCYSYATFTATPTLFGDDYGFQNFYWFICWSKINRFSKKVAYKKFSRDYATKAFSQ